jgi:hypothetical protein
MSDLAFELRRLLPAARLVPALGLLDGAQRQARGFHVRCVHHAERTASLSVLDGRDGTVGAHCFGCQWNGNALHLIGAVRGWNMLGDFRRVLEEAASIAGVRLADFAEASPGGSTRSTSPPPPAPAPRAPLVRPPRAELDALWASSESPATTGGPCSEDDMNVCRFFARRRLWPPTIAALGCCRVLPLEFPPLPWWPASWARAWRLAVLAFESDGTPAALHARAVTDATPKSRWPYGGRDRAYAFSRLLFADAGGQALLRGERPPRCEAVVLVEGITDFLAAAAAFLESGAPYAVLGATAGGFGALSDVRLPPDLPVVIATDHDGAGERYATEIRGALPRAKIHRWRPVA